MKTKLLTLSILSALCISISPAYARADANQDPGVYQVATRLDDYTRPATFTPTKAIPVNSAISENVVTSTQRILNREAFFLKKAMVKPVGENRFSAWELLSDEGGAEHAQTAPNPLTYFATGIASSLLTQLERGIQILDLDVDDVKVETKIFFRYTDTFTGKWTGFTDKVVANILVDSSESPKKIQELKQLALQAWAIGEGLADETKIDAATVINGDDWAGQKPRSGKVESPISVDHGFTLTNVTPDLELQTVEVEADLAMGMDNLPNPMTFTEIGVAESAHDPERPYMHRIRAKSLTENYQTWELYSDDSRGYEGIDKAPTSWDYFTAGTSFCLMSQLTGNQKFLHKQGFDIDDYRVEHQFNYQQDDFMTPAMTGRLDEVITRVIVNSDVPEEISMNYAKQALRMCFAGEAIQNATEMESGLYLNGNVIK